MFSYAHSLAHKFDYQMIAKIRISIISAPVKKLVPSVSLLMADLYGGDFTLASRAIFNHHTTFLTQSHM